MVPFGRLQRIFNAAGGFTLEAGVTHAFVPNTYFKISGGYYFLADIKGNIKEYQTGQISLLGGYYFSLPRDFAVTPMLGAGIQFHYIKDFEYRLKALQEKIRTSYVDPVVTLRCEGSYRAWRGLHVIITPGYTILIEKGHVGHYFTVDAGIRYNFDIYKKKEGA
jgi:hypothetical protein